MSYYPKAWNNFFIEEEVEKVMEKVKTDVSSGIKICPAFSDIFRVFRLLSPEDVDVVIIGQDPYPDPDHADGIAFSSKAYAVTPKTLQNIFKEVDNDVHFSVEQKHIRSLERWVKQGVLLINTHLTTMANMPGSHISYGWEGITNNVIEQLSLTRENLVFILWGEHAKKKKSLIDLDKHFVIESVHPSPLSAYRGFFGSQPFTLCNTFLLQEKKRPINWD